MYKLCVQKSREEFDPSKEKGQAGRSGARMNSAEKYVAKQKTFQKDSKIPRLKKT